VLGLVHLKQNKGASRKQREKRVRKNVRYYPDIPRVRGGYGRQGRYLRQEAAIIRTKTEGKRGTNKKLRTIKGGQYLTVFSSIAARTCRDKAVAKKRLRSATSKLPDGRDTRQGCKGSAFFPLKKQGPWPPGWSAGSKVRKGRTNQFEAEKPAVRMVLTRR